MTPKFFNIKRGDTKKLDIACFNKLDGPLDLTGAVLRFYAKYSKSDPDTEAAFKKDSAGLGGIVVTDAGNGLGILTISPADTNGMSGPAQLYWDLQVTEQNGVVTTLLEGSAFVDMDVTQAY